MRKFVRRPGILAWKDQRGSVAVMTAVCLLLLTGFLGFAIDAGSWEVARRSLQGAADGAAYSAAMAYADLPTAIIGTQAKGITAQQGYVDGANGVTVSVNQWPNFVYKPVTYPNGSKAIEVIVTQPQPRFFSGLYQAANPAVSARAVANAPPLNGPGCVLALNNNGPNGGTISINGNGALTASNCDVAANSTSSSAIKTNGNNATITAPDCTVAGPSPSSITGCTKVTTNSTTVDPYAGVAFPTFPPPACVAWTGTVTGTGPWCFNGINISGGTVSFPRGLYYVNGPFAISGSSSTNVTGTDVTFFIKATNTVSITGQAHVTLSAPTTGTYSGIVFFGDRAGTASITNNIAGNANMVITGVLYFPTEALQYAGNGTSGSGCQELIADVITITGNATFKNGCAGTKPINVANGTGPVAIVE